MTDEKSPISRPRLPPFRPLGRLPDGDRALVIFSDIEMGAGGLLDDFPHSDALAEILLTYNEGPYRERAVDLIFNGDTFDLLKTPFQRGFPSHITREVALGKLEAVAAAHPLFFQAVRGVVEHGHAARRVHFLIGNHDAELAFPEVQARIRQLCGGSPGITFPGYRLDIARVRIEHGQQLDPMFQVDEQAPFLEFHGKQVLNISWGAAALLDTVIPLGHLLAFHDRVKPRSYLLSLAPEIQDLLVERFWTYWGRDFWKGYFRTDDPMKKVTWKMLKEVAWRFTSKNPEVEISGELRQRMAASDEFLLYVIGHKHESQWLSFGDRKILQSGCMRNEYMLSDAGRALRPIPKCYVEVFLRDGVPVVSHFVEFEGVPAPEGYVPRSIFDVIPEVKALLSGANAAAKRERERHEAGEG